MGKFRIADNQGCGDRNRLEGLGLSTIGTYNQAAMFLFCKRVQDERATAARSLAARPGTEDPIGDLTLMSGTTLPATR